MGACFYQARSKVAEMKSHGSQTYKLLTYVHASHLEREWQTALKEPISFT